MAGRQRARLQQRRAPRPAGRAGAAGWRCGCGSCRARSPAPPGCGRTRRSGGDSPPPPRAARGPGAARSRAARPRAPRGRTARARSPAARARRRAGPPASAARRRRSRSAARRPRPAHQQRLHHAAVRGSIRRAPRARPRRSGGAAAEGEGAGARSAPLRGRLGARGAGSSSASPPEQRRQAHAEAAAARRGLWRPAELAHARAWRSARAQDLARELDIGLRARAAEVVQEHRQAVRGRLGDPHVARDDGVVDALAEEAAHVGRDLLGEVVAAIEHGQHHALHLEQRVVGCAAPARPCAAAGSGPRARRTRIAAAPAPRAPRPAR